MYKRIALAVLGIAFAASAAAAQAPVAPKQAISINPLGVVFRVYSGELERSVAPGLTLGAASSYWGAGADFDDDASGDVSYLSFDGKLRYYPGGTSLQGFSLGGSLGYTALSGSLTDADGRSTGRANSLSAGVALDYNWLLGDSKRFLVGTGIGAKRLFPIGVETDGLSIAYPTARLAVGYAF